MTDIETKEQAGGGLLPCPFCGGEPELITWHEHTEARHIRCKSCGCMTGAPHFQREFAYRDWNTRPASPADGGAIQLAKIKYLEDHHHICETAIGLAKVNIKRGQHLKALSALDVACTRIDALTQPAPEPKEDAEALEALDNLIDDLNLAIIIEPVGLSLSMGQCITLYDHMKRIRQHLRGEK